MDDRKCSHTRKTRRSRCLRRSGDDEGSCTVVEYDVDERLRHISFLQIDVVSWVGLFLAPLDPRDGLVGFPVLPYWGLFGYLG